MFSADNKFRGMCFDVVGNPRFDKVVFILIVVSSILLAMENPLNNPNSSFSKTLVVLDVIMTLFFCFECILKIISFGLF